MLENLQEEKRFLLPLLGKPPYPFVAEEARKVSRDAYVSYKGNRYSVPWRVAGQEVMLREVEGHLHVHRAGERLAVHLLSTSGSRQAVTVALHHEGIPLGTNERGGKVKIHIQATEPALPVVAVRSLMDYEEEANHG